MKQKYQLGINIRKLYALVIGKCIEYLKEKLRSLATYKDTDERSNSINFISSINSMAFKFEAHKNLHIETFVLKT